MIAFVTSCMEWLLGETTRIMPLRGVLPFFSTSIAETDSSLVITNLGTALVTAASLVLLVFLASRLIRKTTCWLKRRSALDSVQLHETIDSPLGDESCVSSSSAFIFAGNVHQMELEILANASLHRQRRLQTFAVRLCREQREVFRCSVCQSFEHRQAQIVENHALFCFAPPSEPDCRGWWTEPFFRKGAATPRISSSLRPIKQG